MKPSAPLVFTFGLLLAASCSDDSEPAQPSGTTNSGTTSTTNTENTSTSSGTTTATTSSSSNGTITGAITDTTAGPVTGATTQTTGTATTGDAATGVGGGASVTTGGSPPTSAGGASSTTAAAATGTGGTAPMQGSSGCGMAAAQATGEWVAQPDVTIQGTPRVWAIRLPDDYNPMRAYPLVVELHGCGSGTNNVPVERVAGEDAIFVRGTAAQADVCWNTSPNGPNLEFFDAMVDGVAASACVDENRIFASGYSSGSWLVSVLACLRGDRLRAVATVAGGNALFGNQTCTGTVAQIFVHDQDDTENPWSGHESAMERLIDVNGCMLDDPMAEAPEPCVRYQGCTENPVKYCPTSGQGHNRQDDFAPQAFWDFFAEF